MQREPAEIEREIELTRTYLADTVDAIAHKVSPKEVAGRSLASVKAKVEGTQDRQRGDVHQPRRRVPGPAQAAGRPGGHGRRRRGRPRRAGCRAPQAPPPLSTTGS